MKRIFSIITFSVLFMISCRTNQIMDEKALLSTPDRQLNSQSQSQNTKEDFNDAYLKKIGLYSALSQSAKDSLIDSYLLSMTDSEKIGQLFILAIRHTDYGKPALKVDETIKTFMSKYKPGGIILFSLNFKNPEQTKELISQLQSISPYPLFITTDEEGGKVSRLGKSAYMNVLYLPPAGEIGDTLNTDLAEVAAEYLGLDMKELGFNMNMAPVADVADADPMNPIGSRSFSSDPETAGSMTAAAVRGYKKAGISPVLKHFPGHGNVGGDSHNGAVASLSSREDFYNIDFIPFIKGIEAGTDFIMMGHMAAPALTGTNEPASLSRQIQTVILREEFRYEGLIITDAMDMGAIKNSFAPGEAALKAFLAGSDMILMPENIPEAQQTLLKALSDGLYTQERLDESLRRILKIKLNNGLFDKTVQSLTDSQNMNKSDRHTLITNRLNTQ
ncbi:glycoside hydrolase family 3 protein [Oceanispirochaeta crateris]|uniref:beta-N-acetylhexosaminidase n=1 Tax=Oceanispirochaeta crateris TaxID=2518645 RepID=A0A5C1QHV3_9SPIO|nr:glycoside hydrolase family 3 protein [Oceanispirochaeta crateris]QEN07151.1 glycoside hydrolase family 3 protein [Oceanispirochaeta crateris]